MRPTNHLTRYFGLAILATTLCSCQSLITIKQVPQSSESDAAQQSKNNKSTSTRVRISDLTADADLSKVLPAKFARPCPTCPAPLATLPESAFGNDWNGCDFERTPPEEYVCNGGDQNVSVQVKRDWSVQGLHPGDTVVHFDTIDGKTVVEPSNEVCLYAPRFAAVRKVYGLVAHEQHDKVAGVEIPVSLEQRQDRGLPTTVVQPLQPVREHSVKSAQVFREKTRGDGIDSAQRPATTEDQFMPFEDLAIIRRGFFDNSEKARLTEQLLAAVTWTHEQGLQVLINHKVTVEAVGTRAPQSTYVYELPPGKSKVRVVKIASKQNAKPGELVEFTLRFDNVGDYPIGNVTVIDRIHDRLEFVDESARCSRDCIFTTEDDDGLPRVLRWEITDPLEVGEGGLIRFTCKVR